jgi:predicted DNA-binding transcriptional regulator AlpA
MLFMYSTMKDMERHEYERASMTEAISFTNDLLSIADIERNTGISQRTLWRWVSSGQFPKPDLSIGEAG